MDDKSPYQKLGVKENASFEEIQDAKKRLIQQYHDDSEIVETIEAAYDSIIMDRLRLRQEGKIKVPEKIRFPEQMTGDNFKPFNVPKTQAPSWLQDFLDRPTQQDILQSAGLFLLLSVVTIFVDAGVLSLLTTLGFGATIYFLNRKEQRFGRSLLITFLGLVLGIVFGGLFAYLLNSQAGLNILTNDQISSMVSFIVFWLVSSFLR
jgi:hypothetical protein